MRVAVTGGTGFIGKRLIPMLQESGHDVVALVRDVFRGEEALPGTEVLEYDGFDAASVRAGIEGCDAVINLAGDNVFGSADENPMTRRWNKSKKAKIRDSRVVTTRALTEAMEALGESCPKVLLSGCAIGFYGPRPADAPCIEDEFDASNFAPRDFLAAVCREWEAAAKRAKVLGARVVLLRTGVVIGRGEGALKTMEGPFKMGLGGPVASGEQMMSWIHVTDCCRMIVFALENDAVRGPLNVTGPNPVSNKQFAKALGSAMGRPAVMPMPGFVLKLILGPVAEVVIEGQNVPPRKAWDLGFRFEYPTLGQALAAEYGKDTAPGQPRLPVWN